MTAFSRGIRSTLLIGAVALSCGALTGCKGGGSSDSGAPAINTPSVPVANNPQTPAPQTPAPQTPAPQTPEQAPAPAPEPTPAPVTSATPPASTPANTSTGATLAWIPPTQNIDGSPLTNLAGFVISYGSTQDTLSHSVLINNPNVDSAAFEDLAPGTYYFAVQAVTDQGDLSGLSDLLQKVIG